MEGGKLLLGVEKRGGKRPPLTIWRHIRDGEISPIIRGHKWARHPCFWVATASDSPGRRAWYAQPL